METKTFYSPGDKVRCTKLIDSPEMYVVRKKELTIKDGMGSTKTLQGMVCRYLDKQGIFREELFSTKDLELI